jgi:hypothetical protein
LAEEELEVGMEVDALSKENLLVVETDRGN